MTVPQKDTIVCRAIGIIHSEHRLAEETPIQPEFAHGCEGRIEVYPDYRDGLKDIETFTHLILLYLFHEAEDAPLVISPFLEDTPRGILATRHPGRPNHIGLSVVRFVRREGTVLHVENVDILDATPLIDIKPFVPRFDIPENPRGGWTEAVDPKLAQARGRRGYGRRS